MTREDVLETLGENIKDNLTTALGYEVQPVIVKRGVYNFNDFKGKMPAVCYTLVKDGSFESDSSPSVFSSDEEGPRILNVFVYGYAETDGLGGSKTINNMAKDMESFLLSSDFAHGGNALLGPTEIKEGGVSDPICSYLVELQVIYN